MQEILETKVQLLQEEALLARGEAEQMALLADSEAQRCLALEREMVERMEECGGDVGRLVKQALADKDRVIEELTQQKHSLGLQVEELKNHDVDDRRVHTEMQVHQQRIRVTAA
ncbi:hypothetical protein PAMP_024016 [Pampus punctatissimus]